MSQFHSQIAKAIFESLENEYYENYDPSLIRVDKKSKYKILIEKIANSALKKINRNLFINIFHKNLFYQNLYQYEYLFDLLADERSKRILIELLVYKLLGYNKVRLSLNNEYYWRLRNNSCRLRKSEKIEVNFRDGYLYLYDLKPLGFDTKLFYVETGIVNDYILEQYNYQDIVCVNRGDNVIDAGGCWGDTALYFACRGADSIFSFEFINSNVDIMKKNISMNDHLNQKIHIIEKALWDKSEIQISYKDKGPASKVDREGSFPNKVNTITIDDFIRQNGIDRIDFLKMDIEGAEIYALKGAAKTINSFKPKLAISAYHRYDDLYRLPKLIRSFRNDYKFYLDYYTIVADEIILYAI